MRPVIVVVHLLILIFSGSVFGQDKHVDSSNLRIRKADSLVEKEMYNSAVAVLEQVCSDLIQIPQKSQTDTINQLLMDAQYKIGFASYHIGNHEYAISSFYKIIKNPFVKSYSKMKAYNGIGNVMIARKRISSANEAFLSALNIYNENNFGSRALMSIYNNLSNVQSLKGNCDSALLYLHEAQKICINNKLYDVEPSLMRNFGNNYLRTGNYELAESYYKSSINMAEKQDNRYHICETYVSLGTLYMKQKRYDKAINCFESGLKIADEINAKYVKVKLLNNISNYYEEIGNKDKALYYARYNKQLSDTVLNMETEDKILKIKSDFEIYQVEIQKKMLENELAISKNKIFNRNLNLIIVILIALSLIVYATLLVRRLMVQRRINRILKEKLTHIEAVKEEHKDDLENVIQSKLEKKNKELVSSALFLIKVEEIANELLGKLKLFRTNVNIKGKNELLFIDIENTAKELFVGKGWDEFKLCFEEVNSSFYEALGDKYKTLTQSDKRFAALLSLNLTTKEIAILTNRTVRGVETSKFRLKKKMGLEQDDNLMEILVNIK